VDCADCLIRKSALHFLAGRIFVVNFVVAIDLLFNTCHMP
jgi:hypothetical protein